MSLARQNITRAVGIPREMGLWPVELPSLRLTWVAVVIAVLIIAWDLIHTGTGQFVTVTLVWTERVGKCYVMFKIA